jgi:hypothetical protein
VAEVRNACTILVRKPEGKRTLRRHRHRWEDNIRMDLKEIGLEVVGCCEHSNEPLGSMKGKNLTI